MNRRDSLKAIGLTAVSTSLLIDACKTKDKDEKRTGTTENEYDAGRQDWEKEREQKLRGEKFFTDHEMATITVLSNIIIPKDERSGNASDAGVPEFISFMAVDRPEFQVPLRGGIRWLDTQCLKRYNNSFKDCSSQQQLEMVNEIAYPAKAKPEMQQGVSFFNRMRDLTAIGFFTSKIGIEDLGYVGNRPNKWEGVPADVVKKHGLEDVSNSFPWTKTLASAKTPI